VKTSSGVNERPAARPWSLRRARMAGEGERMSD
jgi:hypothetical protein